MEFIITDEPLEKLVVKPGANDTAVIIQKRRDAQAEDWDTNFTKVIILNRREALLIKRAISHIILEPVPTYEVIRSNIIISKGGKS